VLLPQLRRIRWAVRAALFLGVAASVAANVLHAQPNIISQTISAWPPLALLLTVELTSRIPMHRPSLAALRVCATITIAGIAAWVSYWHMQGVAVVYGETETSAYLLPISVDGLIVVASVSLVELAGRIRMHEERRDRLASGELAATGAQVVPVQFVEPAPVPAAPPLAAPAAVPVFHADPAPEPVLAAHEEPATEPGTRSDRGPRPSSDLLAEFVERSTAAAPVSPAVAPAVAVTTRRPVAYANGSTPPARSGVARPAASAPARTVVTAPTKATGSDTPRQRRPRPVQETADLADAMKAMNPELSEKELADQLGISATRLRQVKREAREAGARR
jgi:hypothetical protein